VRGFPFTQCPDVASMTGRYRGWTGIQHD
jgi:hypothetical protein